MAYYTKEAEAERNSKVTELQRMICKLIIDICIANAELDEMRLKLAEAQERNRKLDWLLTEAMERV